MGLFDYVFAGQARAALSTVKGKALSDRIEDLENQVGELALLCRGLVVALAEAKALNETRLREVMARIDAEDGVVDGRVTSKRGQAKAAKAAARAGKGKAGETPPAKP